MLRLAALNLNTCNLLLLLAWPALDVANWHGLGACAHALESRDTELAARQVLRVIDGDTLVLNPSDRVRLIGVDTPETVHPKKMAECYGKEAKAFTSSMVAEQNVRLVFDDANAGRRHKDRYGRTLGYLYLREGNMLNAELIRQGFAHAYTRFPFRYLVEFKRLEREARAKHLGLWSSCSIR